MIGSGDKVHLFILLMRPVMFCSSNFLVIAAKEKKQSNISGRETYRSSKWRLMSSNLKHTATYEEVKMASLELGTQSNEKGSASDRGLTK